MTAEGLHNAKAKGKADRSSVLLPRAAAAATARVLSLRVDTEGLAVDTEALIKERSQCSVLASSKCKCNSSQVGRHAEAKTKEFGLL